MLGYAAHGHANGNQPLFEHITADVVLLMWRPKRRRRAEEANAVRAEPLGQDRRYNRYWRFAAGTEPGAGRLFVELQVGA